MKHKTWNLKETVLYDGFYDTDGVGPVENSHWLNFISVTYGQAQSNLLESRFFLT